MRKETIFKRENGLKVKIIVSAYFTTVGEIVYNVDMHYCEKGKRTWIGVWSTNDYSWRRLDSEGKRKFIMDACLKYATAEEIQQAKLSLWEDLKP